MLQRPSRSDDADIMATARVAAHDIASSGPQIVPTSPSPPPLQRASTILSQASIQSHFSIKFAMQMHYTCRNCRHRYSGRQSLHFSHRRSFVTSLSCSQCGETLVQFGGSRPVSKAPTIQQKAEAVQTGPSSTGPSPDTVRRLKHQPSVSSGLKFSAQVASSVAQPDSILTGEHDVEVKDFGTQTAQVAGPSRPDSFPLKRNATSGARWLQRRPRLGETQQGKLTRLLCRLRRRGSIKFSEVTTMPNGDLKGNEDCLNTQTKGKEPAKDLSRPLFPPSSPWKESRSHSQSSASTSASHRCDCTGQCHCSHVQLSRDQLLSVDQQDAIWNPGRAFTTRAMGVNMLSTGHTADTNQTLIEPRMNSSNLLLSRMSRSARDSYSSVLTFGSGISSRVSRHLLAPQAPHPTAADPSNDVNMIHGDASGRDSAVNLSSVGGSQADGDPHGAM